MTDMEPPAPPPVSPAPPKPRRESTYKPAKPRSNLLYFGTVLICASFTVVSAFFIIKWRSDFALMQGLYMHVTEWRARAWGEFERGRLMAERAARTWALNCESLPGRDPGADIRTLVDGAIEQFDKTLRYYGDYEEARDWAGRTAMLSYRYDRAIPYFEVLLDRSPEHPALYELAWCRALLYVRRWAALPGADLTSEPESHGLYTSALRDVRWFVNDRGADDRHHLVICAQAVLTDDLIPELYDALDNMEQLDPTDWRYRFMRSWLLLHDGRPDEAIAEGHRLLERFPRAVEGWAVIARAHQMLGRPNEAIEAWTAAIALDPRFAEAYFARGRLREGTEPDAADADVQQALDLAPELAAFLGD